MGKVFACLVVEAIVEFAFDITEKHISVTEI